MSTRTESQQIVKACGCGGLAAVLLTYVRGHVRWTHDEALYTAVCLSAIARTGVDAARDDDALRATAVDEARDEGALRATAVAAAEMWGIVCQTTPGTSLQATATEVDRELRKAREREQKAAMKWGAKRRASGAPSELAQAQEAQRRKKKQEDAVFEARVARLEGRAGASNSSSLPARPVLSVRVPAAAAPTPRCRSRAWSVRLRVCVAPHSAALGVVLRVAGLLRDDDREERPGRADGR